MTVSLLASGFAPTTIHALPRFNGSTPSLQSSNSDVVQMGNTPPAEMYGPLLQASFAPGPHQAVFAERAMAAAGSDLNKLYLANLRAAQIPGSHQNICALNAIKLAGNNREHVFTANLQASRLRGLDRLAALRLAIAHIDNDSQRYNAAAASLLDLAEEHIATHPPLPPPGLSDQEFDYKLARAKLHGPNQIENVRDLLQYTGNDVRRMFEAHLIAANIPHMPNQIQHLLAALHYAGADPDRAFRANLAGARNPQFSGRRACASTALQLTVAGSDLHFKALLVAVNIIDEQQPTYKHLVQSYARGNVARIGRMPLWIAR